MGYYIAVERSVNIYAKDLGPENGKTILFIHGWPVNNKMFEYQYNQLPQMGYRCIGVDLRGFGKSNQPWVGYSYNRLADDIRIVIDSLLLEDITLAGHSMGGAIAIRYMARYAGHKVSKLALFGAAAPSFTRRTDYPYGMTKEEVNKLIAATYNDRPKMLDGFGDMFFMPGVSESLKDWFHDLGLEASGHATALCAISLRDEDLRQDLSRIYVPTGIFHGIHDRVCPFVLAKIMHAGIRGSELIPFEKSGHDLFYSEQEKFNRELIRFMG